MNSVITSHQNPKIKHLLSLDKARERRKFNQFVIEGLKELELARGAGYLIENVFYSTDLIDKRALIKSFSENQLIPISASVFEKVAYRETTGGVIGIAQQKPNLLSALQLKENPLLLILEAIEKPGNLGAILRTADAVGVDAVVSCDPQTDFYNPNVVRSSVGCVFTNHIATASSEETIAWLKKHNIKIYCTYLEASVPYTNKLYDQPCAIVMGSEASGLSKIWIDHSDANVIIPMHGKIDSMNVSVSAAVVLFEAVRQRSSI